MADRIDRGLEVAIGVQQHFNDTELRLRNYALTLLAAVIGASAFAYEEASKGVAILFCSEV
jgi:hypothetical protein